MRTITGVFTVLLTTMALADEGAPLPQHYLQEQEFFAGHWSGRGNIGDEVARVEFRARWNPGRHSLIINGTTRRGTEKAEPVRWTILSGCDTKTGQMIDCFFGSDGSRSVTTWTTKTPKQQHGVEKGWSDGEEFTAECTAVKDGEDKWTYTSATPDGKPVRIVYTRVDDLEAGKDDAIWQDYRDRLAGSWDGTGMIGSDLEEFGLSKGDCFRYHIDWASDLKGRALTGGGKFEVPTRNYTADVRLISAWDPEKRQIRLLTIWSGGLVEELLLSRRQGDSFFGTYSGTFPGRETFRQPIRCKFPDADTEVIVFTGGPRKGEPLSTWKRTK